MKLLVATRNRGKVQEISRILQPAGLTTVDLEEAGLAGEAPEHGQSYLENAAAKALFWSQQYEGPVVADDSGLEVEALGGKPGHLSARYGGPDLTDAQRCQKLLEELAAALAPGKASGSGPGAGAGGPTPTGASVQPGAMGLPVGAGRAAAFRAVCALANGGNLLVSFSGSCQGEIAPAPRGTGGFGYDPIFLYPPLGKTFGEITPEEKDKVSHRAAALRALAEHLKTHGLSG